MVYFVHSAHFLKRINSSVINVYLIEKEIKYILGFKQPHFLHQVQYRMSVLWTLQTTQMSKEKGTRQ